MNKIKKKALRVVILMLALSLVFLGFEKVFRFKYIDAGIYHFDEFYKLEPNTVDVLFVGSSHSAYTYNPGVLFQDYGIAAYNLSGSGQTMWNSYYFIKEALKTQHPQIVVLEGYSLHFTAESWGEVNSIKNNYGMRWSTDKVNSLKASISADSFFEFAFEFNQYHNRYSSLSRDDFIVHQNHKLYQFFKGFIISSNSPELETPNINEIDVKLDLSNKTETYFRMIIELCQKEQVPLEIVVSPYVLEAQHQMFFNKGAEIAEEYNTPFLNYNLNYDQLQFDFKNDMNERSHTNYKGSEKVTKHYIEYLLNKYDLPNRRGMQKWDSWDKNAQMYYQTIQNIEIKQYADWDSFHEAISQNQDYITIVTTTGDCSYMYQQAVDILVSFGINNFSYDLKGSWVTQKNSVIMEFLPESDIKPYLNLGKYRFDFSTDGVIIANTENQNVQTKGVNIVVYDPVTDEIVDSVGINVDSFKRK